MALVLFLALSLVLQGALAEITCEQLPVELCTFSISASGKRCLLEKFVRKDSSLEYQCKTSQVAVDILLSDWIESDECVTACGVDRKTVGISSHSLLNPNFMAKLCSNKCYHNCPNIVDLYFNLALGEGAYLVDLCEKQRNNPRVALTEYKSSSDASGPASHPAATPCDDQFSYVAAAPAI